MAGAFVAVDASAMGHALIAVEASEAGGTGVASGASKVSDATGAIIVEIKVIETSGAVGLEVPAERARVARVACKVGVAFTDAAGGVAGSVCATITGGSLATVRKANETSSTGVALGLIRRAKSVTLVASAGDLCASALSPVHVFGTIRDDAVDVVGWDDERLHRGRVKSRCVGSEEIVVSMLQFCACKEKLPSETDHVHLGGVRGLDHEIFVGRGLEEEGTHNGSLVVVGNLYSVLVVERLRKDDVEDEISVLRVRKSAWWRDRVDSGSVSCHRTELEDPVVWVAQTHKRGRSRDAKEKRVQGEGVSLVGLQRGRDACDHVEICRVSLLTVSCRDGSDRGRGGRGAFFGELRVKSAHKAVEADRETEDRVLGHCKV